MFYIFCKEAIEALNLMKDEWRLSLTDAVVDEINVLIVELKFLDIFLRLQTFTNDRNLLDVSNHAQRMVSLVGSDLYNLFPKGTPVSPHRFDQTLLSKIQENIWACNSEFKAQYSYLVKFMTRRCEDPNFDHALFSTQLICDVMDTLENVLTTTYLASSNTLFTHQHLLQPISLGLHSTLSFSYLLGVRNQEHSFQIGFFTHAIALAGDAAMLMYFHLQETDITILLTDLLFNRILPIQPCVRHPYVKLLQFLDSDLFFSTSHSNLARMEFQFTLFVKTSLQLLQVAHRYGVRVPAIDQHQMESFLKMLGYLATCLEDLPSQGFRSLLRALDNLMVDAALFIFSLYDTEDVAISPDMSDLIRGINTLTYQIIRMSFQSVSPKIDGVGFFDFLLDNMKEYLSFSADSLHSRKNQVEATRQELELPLLRYVTAVQRLEHDRLQCLAALVKELEFLQPFLRDASAQQGIEHDRLQHLATQVIGKAYEIEYLVDCYRTNDVPGSYLMPWLSDLIEEIEFVKAELKKIEEDREDAPTDITANVATSSQFDPSITGEMVGYKDVVKALRDQLVSGTPKELDVISLVGSFGQGKTTVAIKLFNDESVVSLFDARATCFLPDSCEHRKMLLALLGDVVDNGTDLSDVHEEELSDMLHKLLLPKRYLVLIDNVNSLGAWDCLRSCFPDTKNGSRILITTRVAEVSDKARRVSTPHHLRMFSDEESWMLLQHKAFPQQCFPPHLRSFGQEIVEGCRGVPLIHIVFHAVVLAKMATEDLELLAIGDKSVERLFHQELDKAYEEYMFEKLDGSRPENYKIAYQGCVPSQVACTIAGDMVGFEDVMRTIADQLARGTPERDVISIVGMAGQGKTTVANTLFLEESVVSRFEVRAKCCVSQVYGFRELLVDILRDIVDKHTELNDMPEDDLAVMLRRLLLRKRYLILVDDAWETRALDELQLCLPDDKNGSRIILTTRLDEVANYSSNSPHHLRLFSEDESWMLLQKKVFLTQSCPPELEVVGQEIARKCAGLPLSVVLVAGVLASMRKKEQWEKVADDLSSHILADSKHIIQFSYNNLPYNLKPCFLYFGAFLENKDIQISKLIKLWAAEGLVAKQMDRCLADIAEDHLEELIRRNMVMATKKKTLGKVKACRVHDLLLEFCKEKSKEEKFLLWIYSDKDATSTKMLSQMLVQRRISIYSKQPNLIEMSPSRSNVHSMLFRKVADDAVFSVSNQVSFDFHSFKCLRVLDLEFVTVSSFPTELSLLRYLALRTAERSLPSSIANLRNLETLLVKGLRSEISLPHSLCKMVKMRHLHVNDRASFDFHNLEQFLQYPSRLENLETFSSPVFSSAEDVERLLRKTPNLRKLRCIFLGFWGFSEDKEKDSNQFPKLQYLTKLESLKVFCFRCPESSPCDFSFPSNLMKLTLFGFRFPWSEIEVISTLPNLVVLKLKSDAFCGEEWVVRDEQFSHLKVLKLEKMSFVRWITSEDAFPKLEQLVLHSCDSLVEIPSEFSEFNCLQSIEVKSCQESVEESARAVEKIQVEEMQNNGFKLSVSK